MDGLTFSTLLFTPQQVWRKEWDTGMWLNPNSIFRVNFEKEEERKNESYSSSWKCLSPFNVKHLQTQSLPKVACYVAWRKVAMAKKGDRIRHEDKKISDWIGILMGCCRKIAQDPQRRHQMLISFPFLLPLNINSFPMQQPISSYSQISRNQGKCVLAWLI